LCAGQQDEGHDRHGAQHPAPVFADTAQLADDQQERQDDREFGSRYHHDVQQPAATEVLVHEITDAALVPVDQGGHDPRPDRGAGSRRICNRIAHRTGSRPPPRSGPNAFAIHHRDRGHLGGAVRRREPGAHAHALACAQAGSVIVAEGRNRPRSGDALATVLGRSQFQLKDRGGPPVNVHQGGLCHHRGLDGGAKLFFCQIAIRRLSNGRRTQTHIEGGRPGDHQDDQQHPRQRRYGLVVTFHERRERDQTPQRREHGGRAKRHRRRAFGQQGGGQPRGDGSRHHAQVNRHHTVTRSLRSSRVTGPMPLTSNRSSTLVKPPLSVRKSMIAWAVAGPTPGRVCSSSELAVFTLTLRPSWRASAVSPPPGSPAGWSTPTRICSPSLSSRARFSAVVSAFGFAPPAALIASITREPAGSSTMPGFLTFPATSMMRPEASSSAASPDSASALDSVLTVADGTACERSGRDVMTHPAIKTTAAAVTAMMTRTCQVVRLQRTRRRVSGRCAACRPRLAGSGSSEYDAARGTTVA